MSKRSYQNKALGLYLHIPFCAAKCGYCDFYSITDTKLMKDYITALIQHIREYGAVCGSYTVDTVYLGGGTPSYLGAKYLSRILQEVYNHFTVDRDAEITVECNPDSMDKKLLDALKKLNVNRLSIGIQSADDEELKRLGRIHTFEQAERAVRLAQERGFSNISVDLMYGLPEQTQADVLKSVGRVLELEPKHVSCYGLKLEGDTPMGRQELSLPEDDAQADCYLALCARLRERGFSHYEISNFALPGYRSRHNSKYWNLSEYLGLGPDAHSYMNGRRFAFARNIEEYIGGENILRDEDEVPTYERQGEYLMLRLRTSEGVDFIELERLFGVDSTPYEEAFRSLMGRELVAHQGARWYLTEKGFLVSNAIIEVIVEAGLPKQTAPVKTDIIFGGI